MKRSFVEIREEQKLIPIKYISEFLNVMESTITRWIEIGKIPVPTGKNTRFTRIDIHNILDVVGDSIPNKLDGANDEYYNEIVSCDLVECSGGIFLVGQVLPASESVDKLFSDTIKQRGLWNAQGMNNHIHMSQLARNPVCQILIAEKIIDIWIEKIKLMPYQRDYVIYFNGKIDSSICLYALCDDIDINNFDKYLKIENVLTNKIYV